MRAGARPRPAADIRVERSGSAATLVIDRPQVHNALTLEAVAEMTRLLRELSADESLRVLIIRGVGSRAFSAGFVIGDIQPDTSPDTDGSVLVDRAFDAAASAIREAPFPVVAAINGHCMGGGLELALACDLRIASGDANFCMPPARLGWIYGLANLAQMVRVLGPDRARQIFLTARVFDAATALTWGIVHEVAAGEAFDTRVQALVEELAQLAPIALQGLKHGLAAAERGNITAQDRERHAELRRRALRSNDLKEGRAAFLERRKPVFTGT